jgi:hypothetical protein
LSILSTILLVPPTLLPLSKEEKLIEEREVSAMQPSNFEELNSVGRDNGIGAIGEELESGGPTSHRWPREETLALLRIRLEMDSVFRDASPKGPLWEEVSRYFCVCFFFFFFLTLPFV